MSKVKTQYGDLTEKQWKQMVVERLITIEGGLIDIRERLPWTEAMRFKAKYEADYHRFLEKKKKEKIKT